MRTDICKILGIKYPILLGAMTLLTGSALVSAVSNTGGLGILATGDQAQQGGVDRIYNEIKKIKTLTDKPFGVNVPMISPVAREIIDIVCDEKVSMITTGAGNPAPYMSKLKMAGVKVLPVVPTKEAALKMEAAGADMLIAEGAESGGYIGKVSTMVLVAQVAAATKIPVIAAGGFADGRGLAAAFALGACGIQMGTRFIVCKECDIPAIYKEAIISASASDTVVQGAFMAKAIPHRNMKTAVAEALVVYERRPDANLEEYNKIFFAGRKAVPDNFNNSILGAGQVIGLIDKELSAAEIINNIMREFKDTCKDLATNYA